MRVVSGADEVSPHLCCRCGDLTFKKKQSLQGLFVPPLYFALSALSRLLYFALFSSVLLDLRGRGAGASGRGHLPAPPRRGGTQPPPQPLAPEPWQALLPCPSPLTCLFSQRKRLLPAFSRTMSPLEGEKEICEISVGSIRFGGSVCKLQPL